MGFCNPTTTYKSNFDFLSHFFSFLKLLNAWYNGICDNLHASLRLWNVRRRDASMHEVSSLARKIFQITIASAEVEISKQCSGKFSPATLVAVCMSFCVIFTKVGFYIVDSDVKSDCNVPIREASLVKAFE